MPSTTNSSANRSARTRSGIAPRAVRVGGIVPCDKRYAAELTPEQQAAVTALYEQIGPGDEPPYPADGLAPIFKAVAAAQQKLQVTGSLTMAVQVNPQGEATSVEVLRSADRRMVLAAEAGATAAAVVLTGGDEAALTLRDRALAAWARKVVADPNSTTPADAATLRSTGLDDRAPGDTPPQ